MSSKVILNGSPRQFRPTQRSFTTIRELLPNTLCSRQLEGQERECLLATRRPSLSLIQEVHTLTAARDVSQEPGS